jgi:hypothetical protein
MQNGRDPSSSGEKHRSLKRRKVYIVLRLNGSCLVGNVKACSRRRPGTAFTENSNPDVSGDYG